MARHLALDPISDPAGAGTTPVAANAPGAAPVAIRAHPNRPRRGSRGGTNLRDVAKAAKVSVATVSLVLNDSDRISRATKDRVRAMMDELGYQPNRLAQSLSGKYVKVLAAMLPDLRHAFADAYFGELLSGLADAAHERGFKVLLEQAKPDYVAHNRHVELFDRRYVDGVLLLGHTDRSTHVADLCRGDYPAIVVDNRLELKDAEGECHPDYVACDYGTGAQQVMNYLAQLGHRRIGLLEAESAIATVRDKKQAWSAKLRELGVEPSDALVEDGQFTEQGGADATARLLQKSPDLTAILAMSDKMAVGAMHYLQQRGVKVPEDMSVVGFDDLPHAAFVNPGLTTIHLPLYDVGRRACIRLIERVEGKRSHVRELIDTHLVIRDSTALAPTTTPTTTTPTTPTGAVAEPAELV